jgi:hypothetical protein
LVYFPIFIAGILTALMGITKKLKISGPRSWFPQFTSA